MAKNIMKRTLAGTLAVLTVAGAVPADTIVSDVFAKTAISASAAEYGTSDFENLKEIASGDKLSVTGDDSSVLDVLLLSEEGGIVDFVSFHTKEWTANDNYIVAGYKFDPDDNLHTIKVKKAVGLSGAGTKESPYLIGSFDDLNKYLNDDKYTNADGAYIKLTSDIEPTDEIIIYKNTILDFAGHVISDGYDLKTADGVSLTVDDSVGTESCNVFLLINYGELTVNNGYFQDIYSEETATHTTINNGTFETVNLNHGSVDINGGTFASSAKVYLISKNGKKYISGGNFYGTVYCDHEEVNITGGTFNEQVGNYDCTLNITGGTFNGDVTNYGGNLNIENGKFTKNIITHHCETTITDGEFSGNFENIYGGKLNIAGGTFSSDPSQINNVTIPDDYEAVQTGDSTWTVRSTVLQGKGTQESPYLIGSFDDLKRYLNEDKYTNADGAYIKLTSNIEPTDTIRISKNTIFDFAGHVISGNFALTTADGVSFTVDDSVGSTDSTDYNINALHNYGELTVNNGYFRQIYSVDTATHTTINNGTFESVELNCGSVDINGGTFKADYAVYLRGENNKNISGGTFNETIVLDDEGQTNITGGTFNGNVENYDGSMNITGGTFNRYVTNYGENLNIGNGKFNNKLIFFNGETTITDGEFSGDFENQNGELNIENGKFAGIITNFDGNVNITGGTFSSDPSGFYNVTIPKEYDAVKTGESEWTVMIADFAGKGTKDDPYLIGSLDDLNTYLKKDRYTNADGAYIKLTGDFALTGNTIITKNTIIDIAGKTISGAYALATGNGVSVTVNDSENGSGAKMCTFINQGELTVNNGNISTIGVQGEATQTTINDGNFVNIEVIAGDLDINGGTFNYSVSMNNTKGKVNISGGTFGGIVFAMCDTMNITGGTFSGNGVGGQCTTAMTISGGTFSGQWANLNADKPAVITGGTFTLTPYDNDDNKMFEIRGGTFSFDPSADKYKAHVTIPEDYYAVDNGDSTWTVNEIAANVKLSEADTMLLIEKGTLVTNDTDIEMEAWTMKNGEGEYVVLKPGDTFLVNERSIFHPQNVYEDDDTGEEVNYIEFYVLEGFDFEKDGNVYKSVNAGKDITISMYEAEAENDCTIRWKVSSEGEYDWLNVLVDGESCFYASGRYEGLVDVKKGQKLLIVYNKDDNVGMYDDCAEFEFLEPQTLTHVDAKEPTCEEAGNIEHFKDADGNCYTYELDSIYVKLGAGGEIIPATGHTYKARPEWKWDGKNNAAAVFSCEEDDSNITINAQVTVQTTEPKVGEKGKNVYTAEVTFRNKKYTNTIVEWIPAITVEFCETSEPNHYDFGVKEHYIGSDDKFYILQDGEYVEVSARDLFIPALGHDYGEPEWTWDENNKATAKFTCEADGETETVEAEVTSETEKGKTVYTASAKFGDKTYTDTRTVVSVSAYSDYSSPVIVKAGTVLNFDVDLATYIYKPVRGEYTEEFAEPGQSLTVTEDSLFFIYDSASGEEFERDGEINVADLYALDDCTFELKDGVYRSTNAGKPNSVSYMEFKADETSLLKCRISSGDTNDVAYVLVDGRFVYFAEGEESAYVPVLEGQTVDVLYIKDDVGDMGEDCFEFEPVEFLDFEYVDRVEPTCETAGNIGYYVYPDGDKYIDFNLNKNHSFVKIEDGEEVIPALGHTYGEPEWAWDEDNIATATFECEKGDSVRTVEAEVTYETIEATYTADGKTVYTATVEFEGKTYTDTKTVAIPKLSGVVKFTYKPGDNSAALSWDEFEGAEKYAVCGYVSGKWQLIKEVTDTGTIVRGLTAGAEYKMAVIPYVNGEWIKNFNGAVMVAPNPPADLPELSVEVKNNKFVLNWTEVEGAEQYGVAVKIAGKWKVQTVVDADVTTFTSPKLSKGTYEMVVCAKINGKWDIRNIADRAVTGTIG